MKINLSIARQCLNKKQYVLLVTQGNTCLYTCSKHVYKKYKYEAYKLLTHHMTRPQALAYAIYAAESALPQVEERHRDKALAAINAAKAVLKNDTEENRNAANAAANAAAYAAAYAAYAATYAAYAATYAAYAATYAANVAAYAATYAANVGVDVEVLLNKAKEILG